MKMVEMKNTLLTQQLLRSLSGYEKKGAVGASKFDTLSPSNIFTPRVSDALDVIVLASSFCVCVCVCVCMSLSHSWTDKHTDLNSEMEVKWEDI